MCRVSRLKSSWIPPHSAMLYACDCCHSRRPVHGPSSATVMRRYVVLLGVGRAIPAHERGPAQQLPCPPPKWGGWKRPTDLFPYLSPPPEKPPCPPGFSEDRPPGGG